MKYMKKADKVIIGLTVLLALVALLLNGFLFKEKGTYAEIYYDSILVYKKKLTTTQEISFSISEKPEVIFHLYDDGSIAFIESDCPDKICIRSGRLNKVGQSAACLPNKLLLKIVGEEEQGPDLVIGNTR